MAEKGSSSSSGGIGFIGLLTIVFITLKLLGKISWSWVWVLSPIWVSTLLFVGVIAILLSGVAFVSFLDAALEHRNLSQEQKARRIGARRTSGRIIDVESKKDDTFIH